MCRSSGFSLLEVVIASALMALLAAVAFEIFWAGGQRVRRCWTRMQLEERSDLLWQRLLRDLGGSAVEGLSLHNSSGPDDPGSLVLAPLLGVTPQCSNVWGQELSCYSYQPRESRLELRIWKAGQSPALSVTPNAALPTRLERPDQLLLAQTSWPETRIVCDRVELFRVDYRDEPGPFQMPLQFHIVLEEEGQRSDRRYSYSFPSLSP